MPTRSFITHMAHFLVILAFSTLPAPSVPTVSPSWCPLNWPLCRHADSPSRFPPVCSGFATFLLSWYLLCSSPALDTARTYYLRVQTYASSRWYTSLVGNFPCHSIDGSVQSRDNWLTIEATVPETCKATLEDIDILFETNPTWLIGPISKKKLADITKNTYVENDGDEDGWDDKHNEVNMVENTLSD